MLADYLQRPMGWGWVRLKLADYHYDRSAAALRETHTHDPFLSPYMLRHLLHYRCHQMLQTFADYWIILSDSLG